MSWTATLGPCAVMAVALYAPGSLVLVALRRSWVFALAFGPVVSAGVLGVAALGLSVLGVHWSAGAVAVVALVGAGVAAGIGRLTSSRPLSASLRALHVRTSLVAVGAGLVVNAGVVVLEYVRPTGSPESIAQIYDTPFHMAVIRHIVETGDASPLHVGALDGTVGAGFYPALWHAIVALAVQVTGASIPLAVNASVLVLLGLVWPVSSAALAVVVFGRRDVLAFAATACAGLLAVFPWGFLVFGVLYSNLFSFSFAPACVAVLVWIASRTGRDGRVLDMSRAEIATAVVLVLAMVGGLALAQPNTLFTVGVTVLPLVYAVLWRVQRHAPRRSRVLAVCGLTVGLAAGWVVVYHLPALRRTVTWVWPKFETVPQAVGEVALQGFNGSSGQLLVAALVAAGVLIAWFRFRRYWYVAAWAVLSLLYVLAAGMTGSIRDLATGFWYHDSTRLAAATAILAIPLIAVAVDWLTQVAQARLNKLPQAAVATSAVLVVVLALVTGAGPGLSGKRYSLAAGANHDSQHFLDDNERAFLASIKSHVDGRAIANNPYDGSAFAYALYGENVLFKTFQGNWLGTPTADQREIMAHLKDVATMPGQVCPAADALGVHFVLRLSNHPQTLNYLASDWTGVEVDAATPGFSLVERAGDLSLYELTACSTAG